MPAPKKPSFSHDELVSMLDYSAGTGEFRWKRTVGPRAGEGILAGSHREFHGDMIITINSMPYSAHRLAWMHAHGEWPMRQVRHLNGDKCDNRLENLAITPERGNIKDVVSLARVRELLSYDPATGDFHWILGPIHRRRDGRLAGVARKDGYRSIAIDQKTYLAHRLAWFYVHGAWPKNLIDHVNMDRSDNRIANLREATYAENAQNATKRPTNTSGYKGVSWSFSKGKWTARIVSDMRIRVLGYFDTPEAAHAAYMKAANRYHGAFARLN